MKDIAPCCVCRFGIFAYGAHGQPKAGAIEQPPTHWPQAPVVAKERQLPKGINRQQHILFAKDQPKAKERQPGAE